MYQALFRNRWIALAFVGMTLIGVHSLVGSGEDAGLLTRAQAGPPPQEAEGDMPIPVPSPLPDAAASAAGSTPEEPYAFMPDEELITSAEGSDPSGFAPEGIDPTGFDAAGFDPTPQEETSEKPAIILVRPEDVQQEPVSR